MYYKFRLAVELAMKHIIVLFVAILKKTRGLLGFCCGSDLMGLIACFSEKRGRLLYNCGLELL